MIVRPKVKGSVPERKKYTFIVKSVGSDEVVGEFGSFPSIPARYCDSEKFRIIYREVN